MHEVILFVHTMPMIHLRSILRAPMRKQKTTVILKLARFADLLFTLLYLEERSFKLDRTAGSACQQRFICDMLTLCDFLGTPEH